MGDVPFDSGLGQEGLPCTTAFSCLLGSYGIRVANPTYADVGGRQS